MAASSDPTTDPTTAAVSRTIDTELAMITAAVGLVAGGTTRRVVLAGLRFAEPLMPDARRLAEEAGVDLVPLWRPRSEGADLAIERSAE